MTTPQSDPSAQHGQPAHPGQGYPPQQPYPGQPYPPIYHGHNPYHVGPMVSQQHPVLQIRLIEHTGMVFMFSQRSYTVVGTLEQCEAYYRRAQSHCLGAGWWSLASVTALNWYALYNNRRMIRAARAHVHLGSRSAGL